MALKSFRSILVVSFLVLFFSSFFPVERAHALGKNPYTGGPDLPALSEFVSQVTDGQTGELRGLYVPDLFAAPVIQQPDGDHEFVSPSQNTLTQFSLASRFGSTGLLAHNYLAGERFFLLEEGQKFYLIYGDGQIAAFRVKEIQSYQALDPNSTASPFLSMENGALLTTSDLFLEVYNRPGSVILQTCILKDNDPSWGRLFVIAEPYSGEPQH